MGDCRNALTKIVGTFTGTNMTATKIITDLGFVELSQAQANLVVGGESLPPPKPPKPTTQATVSVCHSDGVNDGDPEDHNTWS
jgi:hypothetical protein